MSLRRKIRRAAALVLASAMTFSLTACGAGNSAKNDTIRIGYKPLEIENFKILEISIFKCLKIITFLFKFFQ